MKKIILTFGFMVTSYIGFSQNLPCPHFLCESTPGTTNYQVTNTNGSTYQWVVTGGVITQGQGTNSIEVDWSVTLPGQYNIEVTETDQNGCIGDPVLCDVTINTTPQTGTITHD